MQKKAFKRISKQGNRLFLAFLSVSVIILSLDFYSVQGYAWEVDRTGTVERIIDGDTLETSEETIRLADINTPEVGEPGADEATAYLGSLVYFLF